MKSVLLAWTFHPHLWLHPPPIRGGTHRKLLLACPVNQTASWKKDQFPPMHFLIITLSRLQTIIWICHALFVLPLNCIIHEQSQRLAGRRRRAELLRVDLSLKYKVFSCCCSLPLKNDISPLIGFKVCLGREEVAPTPGGVQAGTIDFALHSTASNVDGDKMKESYHEENPPTPTHPTIESNREKYSRSTMERNRLGALEMWQE